MFEKYKRTLIYSLIAIIVLAVSFAYVFFGITKKDNKYIEEKKQTEYAKNEAETQLLFTDIKRVVNKSFLTTQKSNFKIENQEIEGWKVIFTEMNDELTNQIYKYFDDNNFKQNTAASQTDRVYEKGTRSCIISIQQKNVGVYCGYTK